MKPLFPILLASLTLAASAQAGDVTYRKDIRPVWEQKCKNCHGAASPYLAEFNENKDKYTKLKLGPRMDSYANLTMYTGWPDTGAIMRRLDDGKNTKDGKPGNMYEQLGADEAERQVNLALFKAWVGADGWVLKKFKDLSREELGKIQVKE